MSNAGQVALGVVGGIVGFAIGGPTGAAYGLQLGLAVGNIVSPTQLPGTFGPRLNDKRTTTATLGAPITEVFGSDVVNGTVIWLGDVVEIATTEEVGGKGGPEGENTTFTYTQSIAIGLCKGPRAGVRRIWENGKLVFDSRLQLDGESSEDFAARLEAANEYAQTFTIYLGDEDQLADPTIELKEGVGNVPGYRGLMYIVYTDRLLKDDQGQRHPSFKFEVAEPDLTSIVALASTATGAAAGKFVMTSDDGAATWTMRSTPGSSWHALAASPELFKVIAIDSTAAGSVMQSLDGGVTWALLGSGLGVAGRDVIWADALQLFVAISSGAIFTSPTGEVWTAQVEPSGLVYQRIEWISGLERLVVMAANGVAGAELYSDDAITWVSAATPRSGSVTSNAGGCATDGVGALLFGSALAETFHTADGSVWVAKASSNNTSQPGGAHVHGASAAPSEYVIGWPRGGTHQIRKTVDNGANWLAVTSGVQKRDVSEVLYHAGQYVLLYATTNVSGPGPVVTGSCVSTSPDGLVWTAQPTPIAADSAAWSDMWVATFPAVSTVTIAEIVRRICVACGLAESLFDVSDLESVSIHGYKIDRVTDGRSAIAVLRQIGFFDAVESGGVLKFVRRGAAPVRTLEDSDLGAHEYGGEPPPSSTTRTTQDVELPRQLFIQYRDPARDYEDGQQASPTRLITDAINDQYVDVAAAITGTQALQAAEIMWADAWAGRWQHTFALDASHADLEPTDCVLVPIDGRLERMRIVSAEDSAVVLRTFNLVRDDDGSYVSSAIPDAPAVDPAPLNILASTSIVLLDLPPLRVEDNDAGIYAVAQRSTSGNTWAGASIFRGQPGGALSALATVTNEAVVGTLSSPLAAGPHTIFDESSEIEVTLPRGQFESRPDVDLLNDGANALAIGAHGRWEVVQFGDASQVGPTSWVLSHLLRGRRGTDHNIGTSLAGDVVVLISGVGVVRLPLLTSEVDAELIYRGVTISATLGSGVDQSFTGEGEAITPFSPVHASATDDDGDLLIEWTRRDRLAIEFDPGPVPLSETTEAYIVEIMSDASPTSVLRTLATSTPSVLYTLAQQDEDFGSPGPPDELLVRIYQIGALGRGHVREATV